MGYRSTVCRREHNRKVVELYFNRKELLYDIQQLAYVEGDIMPTDGMHAQHQLQDIVEEGNVDRVSRMLRLAYDEVLNALYPHAKEPVDNGCIVGDELEEPDDYEIILVLNPEFSQTTIRYVATLIHEYMVDKVLTDWTSITKPDVAQTWRAKGDEVMNKIKAALTARRKRVHIRLHPFP